MRRILRALAAAVVLTATAHGGIGDREEQIRKEYGEPIAILAKESGDKGLTKCYTRKGFTISVTYREGRSVQETLVKNDNSEISQTEIRKFLQKEVDAGGPPLEGPRMVTAGVQEWRSTDQSSRVAFYDSATRALFVTTQKFISMTSAQVERNARIERGSRLRRNASKDGSRAVVGSREAAGAGAGNRAILSDLGQHQGQAKPSASPAK